MANQITDNRTLINAADVITNWTGTSPTLDTEIFIQGTGSVAENMTNTRRTILYNMTATQNWSNNVFYLWVNCGVVGVLDTKANGGLTVRFTGPVTTDFFEFYVGGKDSWPNAISGGWVQFVVDIEATPSNTGGTPPATSAIQHIGISGLTTIMTRTADNTWLDAMWRLPDGTPGVIVEGRNGGSTDWNFGNILTQVTTASGTIKSGPGGSYILNAPIQFGINDTSTHGFTDTNKIVFWDNQDFAPSDLYKFSALGNAGGTTNVTWGVKTGTGDDATGAQGIIVAAADSAVRWAMDFDDANINGANFYGCTFIHGGDFQLDGTAISSISTAYIDCSSATISNSEQLRIKVIDANTADGVAYMITDDLSDIVFSSFEFSDGHAVQLTTPIVSSQTSKGNLFSGYGAIGTNDAAVYNNAGGTVTINVTSSGDSPTYRNGTGASTSVLNTKTLSVKVLDTNNDPIQGAQVWIQKDPDGNGASDYGHPGNPFNSAASGNTQGGSTFTVDSGQTVPSDLPSSGWLAVQDVDGSSSYEHTYRYASRSGQVFTLKSEVTGTDGGTGTTTTINETGIGSKDIVEGDAIRNTTAAPDEWAIALSVSANSVTTTPLSGGSSWASASYSVHRLVESYTSTDRASVPLMNEETNASGVATEEYNFGGAKDVVIRVRRSSSTEPQYLPLSTRQQIGNNGLDISVTITEDSIR